MKVQPEVMAVLSRCECRRDVLFLPAERLDRKLYEGVNKCLEALGGKWNRKEGGHVFNGTDPAELLDGVLMTGEYVDWKKAFQFFETPAELADRMVEMACLSDGMRVLEPSAGNGAIVDAIKHSGFDLKVDVCELDVSHHDVLRAKATLVGEDFMKFTPSEPYNCVVANPPFTKQQDVDHVSHMVDCVKAGGRVVSVMSPGITFRTDKKTKAFLDKVDSRMEVEALPENSFKSSGTCVNAVLVTIRV